MSDLGVKQRSNPACRAPWPRPTTGTLAEGQALIEYALILTLIIVGLATVLALTGPAIGNVFTDQVNNLLGSNAEPRSTLTWEQFQEQVAAVSSYTPESPRIETNTPRPATAVPTTAPTAMPTAIPTDTAVPTPGPSVTPPDQEYGYPYDDSADDEDRWETDFSGPNKFLFWNAEYWNYSGSDPGAAENCNSANFNASNKPDGTGQWRTTHATLDFDWGSGVGPGDGVASDFCARYKSTLTLEPGTYTWIISKDDGIRIWVDGAITVDKDVPNSGDPDPWGWISPIYGDEFTRTFTVTAGGEKPIVIDFFDSGGPGKIHVRLEQTGSEDIGQCSWALSGVTYHSAPSAWNDSPSGDYSPGSRCNLQLRGTINLMGSTEAELVFWDRYYLTTGTIARAEIRISNQSTWSQHVIHSGAGNLGWTKHTIDLASYVDEIIELRFVLDATGASTGADGWAIDDISVNAPEPPKEYTIGFYDNMEGASHWLAGDTWARSGESVHQGAQAWSDSPGGNYVHGSNTVLELDGIVNFISVTADVHPEAVFWHHYNLGAGDTIRVEVSSDRETWTSLSPSPIASAASNPSWTQQVISLESYAGQEFYLRFRLDATNDTSVGDGWWIDDFALREQPNNEVALGWCDNVEGGSSNWIANGTWGIVTGPDSNNGRTVNAHGGGSLWSDSPGANYARGGNDALEMQPWLSLPTGSTNPELVFWQQWDVGSSDRIVVEIMRESTGTWQAAWTFTYGGMPPGYGTVDTNFNTVLSWQRQTVDLSSYISDTDRIKVRFRRDGRNGTADGWWLDDICFQARSESTWSLPFSDTMDNRTNWYENGPWMTSSEQARQARAYSDSPGTTYGLYANEILELKGVINLAGTTWPTLYYWDRHELGTNDRLVVEIQTFNGSTWSNWFEVDASASSPRPDAWSRTGTTTSWNRHQGNLTAYAGQQIRLRFRLREIPSSSPSTEVGDGWWIDNVSIVERYNREAIHPNSFNDNAETTNSWWVMDGDWARVMGGGSDVTNIGSGSGLGAGMWTAEFYQDSDRDRVFDADELKGTAEVDAINSTRSGACAADRWPSNGRPCGVGLTADNDYLVRWTRTLDVTTTAAYQLLATSDDGMRIFIDGAPVYDYWKDRAPNNPPDVADIVLTAGSHVVTVEYYENGGGAVATVDFARYNSGWLYSDSPLAYGHNSNASMTLEGLIDLTGLNTPYLRFDQKRDVGGGDVFYVEVSTNGGYTWSNLANWNSSTNWTQTLVSLTSYRNQRVNIRFRIDARNSNTSVGNGWFVDNLSIIDN